PLRSQLAGARQVLRGRRRRLRDQPRGLRRAAARASPLPRGRHVLVPRRRDEQLHLEPALDVPRAPRSCRHPGDAFLRRLARRARRQPRRAPSADPVRGARQAFRAGRRDRPRDAVELRRQQALVVPPIAALSSLPMVRGLLAAALAATAAAVLASPALAATRTAPTAPIFDSKGHLIGTPLVPRRLKSALTQERALRDFERYPKVAAWLSRYPRSGISDEATFDANSREWTVKIWWSGRKVSAGEIAQGTV